MSGLKGVDSAGHSYIQCFLSVKCLSQQVKLFSLGKDCQESLDSDLSEEADERTILLVLYKINESSLCAKIVWHVCTDQVMFGEL